MKRRETTFLLAIAWSLNCFATLALADESQQVDAYVQAELQQKQVPGLALLVVRQGVIAKSQGYGLANVEQQTTVTSETIFQSGSVGKQFTATAVMLLVGDGKLSLDDPVSRHLEPVPAAWQKITVRQLLSHTAGVGSYPADFDLRRDYTEDELLQTTFALPPVFAPGEGWQYSNPGYVVLGILIHKVSGQFYGDFLQQRVFKPLGMNATRVISEADIIPRRAAGYRLVDGQLKNQEWVSPSLNTTADGSLYFNLVDLAKWDGALGTERLLKREAWEQMWAPAKLNSGQPNPADYGFGWISKEVDGHRVVEHSGAWQGFTSHISRYVDDRVTVAVLSNLSEYDPRPLAKRVAEVYVGGPPPALK